MSVWGIWTRWCRWTPPASRPISTPPARPEPEKGAGSSYKDLAAEPPDHAIGRSRGGLTTKIHALADTACAAVVVQLSAGQAGDNPMLWPLLHEHQQASPGTRPRLMADKAYSHNSTRARLRQMRIPNTIPEKSDQITWRKAKGSAGGRPPAFDPRIYRQRNTIERGFNRLKQWRGIATRYDKYATTYLGGVTLAALVTYHRTHLADTP